MKILPVSPFKNMISLQLKIYFNSFKLGDMLYIRKANLFLENLKTFWFCKTKNKDTKTRLKLSLLLNRRNNDNLTNFVQDFGWKRKYI
jgi:hypothetical protein